MTLVFDTETTGIPRRRNGVYDPKNTADFDTARLVSISWKLADFSPKTFIVRPEGFEIPEFVSRIHGITHKFATDNGFSLVYVLRDFLADVQSATLLVAHNIDFDLAIVRSELHRVLPGTPHLNLTTCASFCTMLRGQEILRLPKWPKLHELYRLLTGTDPELGRLHRAEYDIFCCGVCYDALVLRTEKEK